MVNTQQTIVANEASVVSEKKVILERVNLECCEGEWVLLYGPSGAGKSTLLNLLNGLCRPKSGSVTTLGSTHPGRSRRESLEVWNQCGTLLQEVALFDSINVLSNVLLPLRGTSVSKKTAKSRADYWLERLNLVGQGNEFPSQMSGGQQQRVALARAFISNPKILFLDEPFSALDADNAANVADIIAEFVEDGATVVMSSHQTEIVIDRCHTLFEVNDGQVLENRGQQGQLHTPL